MSEAPDRPPLTPAAIEAIEKAEREKEEFLSNAVKFSPRGGTVSVHVAPTDDQIEVTVRDEGVESDGDNKGTTARQTLPR